MPVKVLRAVAARKPILFLSSCRNASDAIDVGLAVVSLLHETSELRVIGQDSQCDDRQMTVCSRPDHSLGGGKSDRVRLIEAMFLREGAPDCTAVKAIGQSAIERQALDRHLGAVGCSARRHVARSLDRVMASLAQRLQVRLLVCPAISERRYVIDNSRCDRAP
jgi:hypothetical protein